MHEARASAEAHFITLTYADENLPLTSNGYPTLRKEDLQNFFKRFRKRLSNYGKKHKIKYYAAGEYGSKTQRPHYHILLYTNFQSDIYKLVSQSWELGDIYLGIVTIASCKYVCQYIDKGRVVPSHELDDRLEEKSYMSKGLGASYLTPEIIKYHKKDIYNRYNLTEKDGYKIAMPRYYKEKIYSKYQRGKIGKYIQEVKAQEPELTPEKQQLYDTYIAYKSSIAVKDRRNALI